ncbi:MAG: NFACT RNA binding domain-containing protein [Lachnospiraceae bacterium]|nr:NFACT RNA binding domain-containing protein [Lachnospiraceae bacterium]
MAFDGITIACIRAELDRTLKDGRIYKIAQPEADELLLTIKVGGSQKRLLISAGASLPLVYLTDTNKQSPMTAPNFCMLLRKHIQNGRILSITQPGLERILHIDIEHLNELGDLCKKILVIEIMGKHSNIIFCDDHYHIIDSIKHISNAVSSVREVLPGRDYFIPPTQDKRDPLLAITEQEFHDEVLKKPLSLCKAIYMSFIGFSPVMAMELCHRASLDGNQATDAVTSEQATHLFHNFTWMVSDIKEGSFHPEITSEKGVPVEFSALPMTMYSDMDVTKYDTISEVLEYYYARKNAVTRIRQRSVDLRRIVQTALERNVKKYDLQLKQLQDTEKKDKYKIYGELINTYGYGLAPACKSFEALNYYTNEMITIPLDPLLNASENSKKYFDKYQKLKRTHEAVSELILTTKSEIEHLESISTALDIALLENDLVQIKEELVESGYIKRKGFQKKVKITSKPFHYVSSDGFDIYVGKNNFQNDELTFKFAIGNDWWFHAKGIPGSHVVVKTNGNTLPDRTFEEAGKLAAYYSKGREQDKVEIDYTEKKNVKKPGGSKPGFVVYYTNYSLTIDSDISGIKLLD